MRLVTDSALVLQALVAAGASREGATFGALVNFAESQTEAASDKGSAAASHAVPAAVRTLAEALLAPGLAQEGGLLLTGGRVPSVVVVALHGGSKAFLNCLPHTTRLHAPHPAVTPQPRVARLQVATRDAHPAAAPLGCAGPPSRPARVPGGHAGPCRWLPWKPRPASGRQAGPGKICLPDVVDGDL